MTMTPDEIAAILAEIANLKVEVATLRNEIGQCTKNDAALWRMLYLLLGVALGSGALTLSQVIGLGG